MGTDFRSLRRIGFSVMLIGLTVSLNVQQVLAANLEGSISYSRNLHSISFASRVFEFIPMSQLKTGLGVRTTFFRSQ